MSDAKKPSANKLYLGLGAVIVVIVIIAIIAVATGVLGQNGTPAPTTGAPATKEDYVVNANVNKDCAGTPWFVGELKGFFKDAGISFNDKGHLDWAQQPAAFASGQTNVIDLHPNSLINLIKAGAKVHGVILTGAEPAAGNKDKEHMHWLVLNNSTLKTADDVKNFQAKNGRKVKIAVGALGICADLETNAWLRANGLSQNDVEYVVLGDPNQEQALRQGQIDVATLHPPFFTATEGHGGVRPLFTSRDAFGDAAGVSLLIFGDDYIKTHPDTVRKFTKAFHAAEAWANDNRGEAADITAKQIGLDKSTVHYYSYTGKIDDALLQKWIDAMVADGQLKPGEFKPSDLYTTEFSDLWVNPTGGSVGL